jgi:hypothetical protein
MVRGRGRVKIGVKVSNSGLRLSTPEPPRVKTLWADLP